MAQSLHDLPVLAPGENALLLVDLQEGFLREHTRHLREPVQVLVRSGAFRAVLATRFLNRPGSLWTEVLGWRGLLTPEEQALAVQLPPGACVIDKSSYGLPENAAREIAEHFAQGTVYLAGIETDVCVSVIAAQLFDHGLPPVILAGFTASARGPGHQTHALVTLGRIVGASRVLPGLFAHVLGTEPRPASR